MFLARPYFDQIAALELYDHEGDTGDHASGEKYEWDNLAYVKGYESIVAELHAQLLDAVKMGLVRPMKKA